MLSFAALEAPERAVRRHPDGFVFALNPPSIPGIGTTGGFEFYLQNRGAGDARATGAAVETFVAKARQRPELQGVSTTYRAATQQLFVDLDRSKAEALGVTVSDAFTTMQAFFGSHDRRPVLAVLPRVVGDPAGGRELPDESRRTSTRCSCARRAAPTCRCRR